MERYIAQLTSRINPLLGPRLAAQAKVYQAPPGGICAIAVGPRSDFGNYFFTLDDTNQLFILNHRSPLVLPPNTGKIRVWPIDAIIGTNNIWGVGSSLAFNPDSGATGQILTTTAPAFDVWCYYNDWYPKVFPTRSPVAINGALSVGTGAGISANSDFFASFGRKRNRFLIKNNNAAARTVLIYEDCDTYMTINGNIDTIDSIPVLLDTIVLAAGETASRQFDINTPFFCVCTEEVAVAGDLSIGYFAED